jgi:hypothetical protein
LRQVQRQCARIISLICDYKTVKVRPMHITASRSDSAIRLDPESGTYAEALQISVAQLEAENAALRDTIDVITRVTAGAVVTTLQEADQRARRAGNLAAETVAIDLGLTPLLRR